MPLTTRHTDRIIAVFGGTGFLGRRVVRQLRLREFTVRVVSRHPADSRTPGGDGDPHVLPTAADIHDERSIRAAIDGTYGVVNAVSLYVEHGSETFQSVHIEAAARLARLARGAGVQRLAHLSGIGADATSSSPYIRSRGEGEQAVRAAFGEATLVRPAVMFGRDDAFLNTILNLLRRLPVYPMFGSGTTRLQPAHVEDVGDAITRAIEREEVPAVVECGGPRVYSYQELITAVAQAAGLRPRLVPVPFAVWHALARMAEALPSPPLTRNQVELMQIDSVASHDKPGFAELGIRPRSVEQTLDELA